MEIANPMFDSVFKYLMEENHTAMILLSAITGLEIIALEPMPQEIVINTEARVIALPAGLSLSIFDPFNQTSNHQIMELKETEFPAKFKPVLRRLEAAAQDRAVRESMTAEEEFVAEIQEIVDRLAEVERSNEELKKLKEDALNNQKEEFIAEIQEIVDRLAEVERSNEELKKQKEEALHKEEQAIRLLLSLGMSKIEIAAKMGLSESEMEKY